MGQKLFTNSTAISASGYYVGREVYESGLLVSSLRRSGCGADQSVCEFDDYCSHRYYINDRCDCACTWKKTTGLVIPTST